MICLSPDESETWCSSRSIKIEGGVTVNYIDNKGVPLVLKIPEASRRHAHLSNFLIEISQDFVGCLILITEFGIWPSEENPVLVTKFREAFGEKRPLPSAPGHLFDEHEKEAATAFVRVIMTFGWGGYVIPANGRSLIFLSHDEFVSISASMSGETARITGLAQERGFEQLD